MRVLTGLTRVDFAVLARPRATGWAPDSQYLLESGLLGLHDVDDAAKRRRKTFNFAQ